MLHGMYTLKLRKDGTVCIPKAMREALGGELVLVGVNDHVEIWPAQAYGEAMKEAEADFDELIDYVYQKVEA